MKCRRAFLFYRADRGWFVRCFEHGRQVSEPTRDFDAAKIDLQVHELGVEADWTILEGWLTR